MSKERTLIDFLFPLDDGYIATLKLPKDLTTKEANRLADYIKTLAVQS